MKKIFYSLLFTASFSLNSAAQTASKVINAPQKQEVANLKTVDDAASEAKLDVKTVANFIALDDATVQAFYQLLTHKYEVLYDVNSSAESKSIVRTEVAAKIRATLNATQLKQLEGNTALFSKVIN